jgi:prepilin-type N-terminal cleavage/methylation domain-containing protein
MQFTMSQGDRPMKLARYSFRGFSLLELVVVMAIVLTVGMVGLPSLQKTLAIYKGSGAVRNIGAQLAMGRMRATADFTRVRLSINTTDNTYTVALYNKTTAAYDVEGGTQYLPTGVSFGFGSITTPAGSQSTIGQTTNIYFNSRGAPVDSSGATTSVSAIYLNNDGNYYAVTVSVVGLIRVWKWTGSAWDQQ